MAETAKVRRNGCAGLTIVAPIVAIIVATLLATVFPASVLGTPRPRRRPAWGGMSGLPRRQEHDHDASRQNGFAVRGRQEICRFRTCQLRVHGLPRRPGRKGFPARHAAPVKCGTCHATEQELYAQSLHGKAIARGDPLAPRCVNCHGNHDIVPVKDPRSRWRR